MCEERIILAERRTWTDSIKSIFYEVGAVQLGRCFLFQFLVVMMKKKVCER